MTPCRELRFEQSNPEGLSLLGPTAAALSTTHCATAESLTPCLRREPPVRAFHFADCRLFLRTSMRRLPRPPKGAFRRREPEHQGTSPSYSRRGELRDPVRGSCSPETSVRRGSLARSWLDSRRIDFHRPIRQPDIPRWLLQSRWAPSTVHRAVRSPTTTETVTRFGGSKQRYCVATTGCFCGWLSPCGDCQSSFILGQGMASTPPNGTTVIAYDNAFTPTQTARTLLVVKRMGFWIWSQKEPSARPRAARRAFPRRKITVRFARSALFPGDIPEGKRA